MNLACLNEKSDREKIRAVMLHQTGHVLGLAHEHPHHMGHEAPWDKTAVCEYFKYNDVRAVRSNV